MTCQGTMANPIRKPAAHYLQLFEQKICDSGLSAYLKSPESEIIATLCRQQLEDETAKLKLAGLASELADVNAQLSQARQDAKACDEKFKEAADRLRALDEEAAEKPGRSDQF